MTEEQEEILEEAAAEMQENLRGKDIAEVF